MQGAKLTLVLMAGLPGAGKTTLARQLGRELQWHVIDKDGQKEVLLKQGLDNEQAGTLAYELSFHIIRAVLTKQRTSVIFDTASLHTFILEKAREIILSVKDAQLKVILCVADRDLRNRRLRDRPAQITTIRVDPATISDYLQQFKHLPSDTLILYTTRSVEECLAAARNHIMI
jgi:predicted kinase